MLKRPRFLVAIGASAGGLEGIQEFFNNMPKSEELSFVIVQHLSPDFKSVLSDLLTHNTTMPIITASENIEIKPGAIYLLPTNYEAEIKKNQFKLSILNRKEPIQVISTLFESLARDYKEKSIGIILSGTGSDGAKGITKIAQNRGLTIVQSPNEAKFAAMPKNVINTNHVNFILSVNEMPDLILDYITNPDAFNKTVKQTKPTDVSEYSELLHLLKEKFDVDFTIYKAGTITRRIQRRMQLLNITELEEYIRYLKAHKDGFNTLYHDLLIGVTEFFRDPEAFAVLEKEVIPALFKKQQQSDEPIRVWINPCATGEEAYSIAILLKKYADEHDLPFSVKLIASDVCKNFIRKARKGQYAYDAVDSIPKDILNKYFIKLPEYYEVIPEIKESILFTTQNLLSDPPFTKMDLICCRNLLIYINKVAQIRISRLLRFGLNIGGFLFLGPSEGISELKPDLMVFNQQWKIYKKTKKSAFPLIPTTKLPEQSNLKSSVNQGISKSLGELPLYAYNAILQDVVTSGFVIDSSYAILHSIGHARELIVLPEGTPLLILPKIIHEDLKSTLIIALHQAKSKLKSVICDNIPLNKPHTGIEEIKMTVNPICEKNDVISYYWIRFEPATKKKKDENALIIQPSSNGVQNADIILALESELTETKTLLQSSLENMETVNEELQSANEELMASNEELQSANEELQSVNEELYSVNEERTKKMEEVIQAKADIENLIRSANICTIILNEKLEIRIFTPPVEKIFNLVHHDIGRPLKNFRHDLQLDDFIKKASHVLKTQKPFECEVQTTDNYWYFLKITPYYAMEVKDISGVVITLTDINESKILKQKKEEVENNLKLALNTGLIGTWHYNLSNHHLNYDETIRKIFGLKNLSCVRNIKSLVKTIHPDDRQCVEKALIELITNEENFDQSFRIIHSDKSVRHIACSANLHKNAKSNEKYISGICWDITEQSLLNKEHVLPKNVNLTLDAFTNGWWEFNTQNENSQLSPGLKSTLGYDDHELPCSLESFKHRLPRNALKTFNHQISTYLGDKEPKQKSQIIRARHKEGHLIWLLSRINCIKNRQGKKLKLIGTIINITNLKQNEQDLKQLAYRDFLTNIPNRPIFLNELSLAIARSKRNKSIFALMYVDIDDYKNINDQYVHDLGDIALQEIVHKIKRFSRESDVLARIGGDEFGIILQDLNGYDEVHAIATRYIDSFATPTKVNGHKLAITVSIGIAFYPKDGKTEHQLLKHADKNMYHAKKEGKNQFVL